ncbi:hypothetical protein [Parasphingorhabdus sp.]|uniref:hypothetical protein n=1 Tax=Parasphingorhabdus sp. TaxID=2709688 RepID=UPI003BAE70D9
MSKVGSFLFHWSWLEQQLSKSIVEMREALGDQPKPVKGELKKRLDIWSKLLERTGVADDQLDIANAVVEQALTIKAIRNIIVHGLWGGDNDSPSIECVVNGYEEPGGKRVRYTLDNLEHFAQATDACRRAFIDLSYFNYMLDRPLAVAD